MPKATGKLLTKRNQWRDRECAGCHHNYYNWPKPASPRGDVAVPSDYCCWHLESARRGKGGMPTCHTHQR